VVLCFIGISGPETSEQRVAMRVSQGGHDVPPDKLVARFPRTMVNLRGAIGELSQVIIFTNDDLAVPFEPLLSSTTVGWFGRLTNCPSGSGVCCRHSKMDKTPNLSSSQPQSTCTGCTVAT
jgi:hypothetical protein